MSLCLRCVYDTGLFLGGSLQDWQVCFLFVLIYLSSLWKGLWTMALTTCTWSKCPDVSICRLLFTQIFQCLWLWGSLPEMWEVGVGWFTWISLWEYTWIHIRSSRRIFRGENFRTVYRIRAGGVMTLPIDPASLISTACWGLFFQAAGVH